MKTPGIDEFYKQLNEIFEQGNPTIAQILDAYNKCASQSPSELPEITDEEIEKWADEKFIYDEDNPESNLIVDERRFGARIGISHFISELKKRLNKE